MLNQSEDMGADEFRKVRSAERALDLLELLATSVEGLSFSQIGSALGLPKSSLSGLIRTLDARGYVTRTGDGRRFRLGPRIAELSAGLRQDEDIIGAARRAARRLAQQLGEGAHVAILDGDSVIYIAVEDSTHSMHMASAVGQRLPTHATAVGKSLLAVLSDSAIDLLPTPLEARTEQTITSTADLKRELAHIRRLGYAYDVEELAAGLHSIAAPVLDHTGHAVAAIGVSIPRARLDAGVITHIAALVR
jgi:DNA-binding IclR family transcriptional regulator